MNIPMPPAVECFKHSGMPLTICSRIRVTVRIKKKTPEKKITTEARRLAESGIKRRARMKKAGAKSYFELRSTGKGRDFEETR